jgi:SPASM domain peptide maturase of grasp-with-spasm system
VLPFSKPEFDYPSSITNAIIEIGNTTDFNKLTDELQKNFCYNIQIVASNPGLPEAFFKNMVHIINRSIFKHCELVIAFEDYVKVKEHLTRTAFPELILTNVYNAPQNKINYSNKEHASILFSTEPFSYDAGSNIKNIDLFQINPVLFAESLKFNTYYNRKLFIDKNGMIKNGPLSETVCGNVYTDPAWNKVIKNKDFKKLWKVKKEAISICKICEFRHMCTDARIPLQHENSNGWYHITECNYNPYISKWKGEPGYVSLEQSGITVNKNGVFIGQPTLLAILKKLYSTA